MRTENGPKTGATNMREIRATQSEGALCPFTLGGPLFGSGNGPGMGAAAWSTGVAPVNLALPMLRVVEAQAKERRDGWVLVL